MRLCRPLPFLIALLASSTFAVEDDLNDTPTNWVWNHNQPPSAIDPLASQGMRVVDLEVESRAPTFTFAMAEDSGSYAKTWWWYSDLDAVILGNFLNRNQARLVDLEPYESGGQLRLAAVIVSNTGAGGFHQTIRTNGLAVAFGA